MSSLPRFASLARARSLALGLLLVACQQAPSTGQPCDLNSDCPPLLECTAGRCQEECIDQRDCMSGLHCVRGETTNLGVCLLDQPLDHTSSPCGPGRACAEPGEICRDFTCWNPCETGADCPVPGAYCRRGICVSPRSPGYGYGLRVPCTTASDCASGELCASDHGSQRACLRPCAADAECADVAAQGLCAEIDDPAQPAGTRACVIGCDPVRQQGCLRSDRCDAVSATSAAGAEIRFLDCRGPTGDGIQGTSCGTDAPDLAACGQSLGCAPAMVDMTGGYECRRYCVTSDDCRSSTLACTARPVDDLVNVESVILGVLGVCEGAM